MPRYSATAAGANIGASPSRVQRIPSISPSSMPASSSASRASFPYASSPNMGVSQRRWGAHSAVPLMAARRPLRMDSSISVAPAYAPAPRSALAACVRARRWPSCATSMRIASLLPSATEIVFAVGAGDEVVGVSHECDYPDAARDLPVLTGPAVETRGHPQAEIDAAISSLLASGGSTYAIDVPRLRELQPDLVITQALCDVCAVSEGQVHRVVHEEQLGARVLTLTPLDLEGVARSIEEVGQATGRPAESARLAADLREPAMAAAASPSRRRVLALEWFDPPFTAGHWVPEQIACAGGEDVLALPGQKSERVTWDTVAASAPDVALLLPCGLSLDEVVQEAATLAERPQWRALPAVRNGAVWALDANAWFSRPGPRLLDGIEALRAILADPTGDQPVPGARRLPAPSTLLP
ncbi:MAG: cobalamin-binding protein [Dehalococcoidia bacterium]|nr:cobalamin-binding protein [Dehalococcoidia bacterium]